MNNRLSRFKLARRSALQIALVGLCAAAAVAIGVPAGAQVPALPKSPVTINIVDVAGNLALTQIAI
jgi:hypothetical protein